MALQTQPSQNRYAAGPSPSGLADVLDLILDKGLVIDLYVRVSLVGIELLTVDARIVVASVDTYLRFAEAVGRLNIADADNAKGLPQLVDDMTSGAAKSKTKGALDAAKEKWDDAFASDGHEPDEDEDEDDLDADAEDEEYAEPPRRRRREEA